MSHRHAPLHVRERLAFHTEELPRALNELMRLSSVEEAAILSTCNRTEIYVRTSSLPAVVAWLVEYRRLLDDDVQSCLYTYQNEAATRHAFSVASGLDSMVLGEPQILGQMKEAVRIARDEGALGGVLEKLFQSAFSVAKDVRTTTAIGANIVSMAAAVVRLAERVFNPLCGQRLLFIGAGEMIERSVAHFSMTEPECIVIANRTVDRGRLLAARFGGEAIRLEDLGERLPEFDVVVTSTASQLPILGLGMVERAARLRNGKPLFMADLAVPRDIEPEVSALPHVFLHTIDDLSQIVEAGRESRQSAVSEAELIIEDHVRRFMRWAAGRTRVPMLRMLREHLERMARHETDRAKKKLSRGESADLVLEELTYRLTHKFLHRPTQALQHMEGDVHALESMLGRLFHLHKE